MTVYIDTETTGLYSSDEIVEIAIIDDHQTLLNTLVKPVRHDSWPEAQGIHGISPDDVSEAPTYDDLRSKIKELVSGQDVVIYNADYDSMFLGDELKEAESVQCCMLDFSEDYGEWNDYHGNYRWQKLTTAARYVMHQWEGKAHRALADTLATRSVWQYLRNPKERERINKLREDRELEKEASRELTAIEYLAGMNEKIRIRNNYNKVDPIIRRWVYGIHVSKWVGASYSFDFDRKEDAHIAYTGYVSSVWDEICQANKEGVPVFEGGKTPKGYITREDSKRVIPYSQKKDGLLVSSRGKFTTPIYKNRRIQHLPRQYKGWSSVPFRLATETSLRRDWKVPKKVRDKLKIAAYVDTQYQSRHTRYALYKVPEEYLKKKEKPA